METLKKCLSINLSKDAVHIYALKNETNKIFCALSCTIWCVTFIGTIEHQANVNEIGYNTNASADLEGEGLNFYP